MSIYVLCRPYPCAGYFGRLGLNISARRLYSSLVLHDACLYFFSSFFPSLLLLLRWSEVISPMFRRLEIRPTTCRLRRRHSPELSGVHLHYALTCRRPALTTFRVITFETGFASTPRVPSPPPSLLRFHYSAQLRPNSICLSPSLIPWCYHLVAPSSTLAPYTMSRFHNDNALPICV